jgi:FixJ family two-component response regulator
MMIEEKVKMVAIVDDDDSIRTSLQDLLKSAGVQASSFASAEEFLMSGHPHDTACLITDIRMPGMSGLELQERCRIPTIFITATDDARMRMRAMRAGAVEFFTKPFDCDALLECVRVALKL